MNNENMILRLFRLLGAGPYKKLLDVGVRMTAVLLPRESRYFAIYTIGHSSGRMGGAVWDLHATAQDKRTALDHARLLALQPNVVEVQVKQVTQHNASGQVCVREIRRCRKQNGHARMAAAFAGVLLMGAWLLYAFVAG